MSNNGIVDTKLSLVHQKLNNIQMEIKNIMAENKKFNANSHNYNPSQTYKSQESVENTTEAETGTARQPASALKCMALSSM